MRNRKPEPVWTARRRRRLGQLCVLASLVGAPAAGQVTCTLSQITSADTMVGVGNVSIDAHGTRIAFAYCLIAPQG